MNILKENPKRTIELAKQLNRTQKAITWTMDKLENKGLVERVRKGRNIIWKLTNNGSNLINNGLTIEELKNN